MNSDQILEKKISSLISDEPLLRGSDIDVTVHSDIILLRGRVDQLRKKYIAKKTVQSAAPSKMIHEEIDVILDRLHPNVDSIIMMEIIKSLNVNLGFSGEKIITLVQGGVVTLQGQIPWNYQKDLAEESICHITGIRNIKNLITISPSADDFVLKNRVTTILRMITVNDIEVVVNGKTVILKGKVTSSNEKATIARLVQKAIGDARLNNELLVRENLSNI